jgi:hypothetical protein
MRTPRKVRTPLTPEMLELFKRGLEILAAGADEIWGDEGGRREEYLAISRRLNWVLLRQPIHAVSVLDPELDGEMPGYMENLASGKD